MTFLTGLLIAVALPVCLVLMFRRWFWGMAFAFGSLASSLELLACIAQLRIARALGYFFLMFICWSLAKAIAEEAPARGGKAAQETSHTPGAGGPDWSPP